MLSVLVEKWVVEEEAEEVEVVARGQVNNVADRVSGDVTRNEQVREVDSTIEG